MRRGVFLYYNIIMYDNYIRTLKRDTYMLTKDYIKTFIKCTCCVSINIIYLFLNYKLDYKKTNIYK